VSSVDRAQRHAALVALSRQVTARRDLDDVLGEVFRSLRPLVEFGGGSIQLVDDDGWIRMAAADPVAPERVMSERIPLGGSVAGRVILTEQPVYLPDIAPLPDSGTRRVAPDVRSYLAVPLVADGRALGLLQVDSPEPDTWSDSDRELFIAVAPVVAAAIHAARFHAQATAARGRADALEACLDEARAVLNLVRVCLDAGDDEALSRHLARLDGLIGRGDERPHPVRVPTPRAAVS
jgi:GAF domain-containing protein